NRPGAWYSSQVAPASASRGRSGSGRARACSFSAVKGRRWPRSSSSASTDSGSGSSNSPAGVVVTSKRSPGSRAPWGANVSESAGAGTVLPSRFSCQGERRVQASLYCRLAAGAQLRGRQIDVELRLGDAGEQITATGRQVQLREGDELPGLVQPPGHQETTAV